jgi:hypothetical protein
LKPHLISHYRELKQNNRYQLDTAPAIPEYEIGKFPAVDSLTRTPSFDFKRFFLSLGKNGNVDIVAGSSVKNWRGHDFSSIIPDDRVSKKLLN